MRTALLTPIALALAAAALLAPAAQAQPAQTAQVSDWRQPDPENTLVIDTNQIVVNITGQTGSLLGNLLCAITNLLNGGPLANIIQGLPFAGRFRGGASVGAPVPWSIERKAVPHFLPGRPAW